ncbi:MAG: hypothetical protein IT165_08915 [Bryobacterales bacterium]|nr:hypothetical protein [Bryobacterales bacterium]
MTPLNKQAKSHYSETEAAVALGVSVDELRSVIRSHVVKGEEEMANVASAMFQPSDLLVLRMLLSRLQAESASEAGADDEVRTATV